MYIATVKTIIPIIKYGNADPSLVLALVLSCANKPIDTAFSSTNTFHFLMINLIFKFI